MKNKPKSKEPMTTTAIIIKASQMEWARSEPGFNLSAFVRDALAKEIRKHGH